MTENEANILDDGLYLLHWDHGGAASPAAVYHDYRGDAWFAPASWTGPSKEWFRVERAEPIPDAAPSPAPPAQLPTEVRELLLDWVGATNGYRAALIRRKLKEGLDPSEADRLDVLRELSLRSVELAHPDGPGSERKGGG